MKWAFRTYADGVLNTSYEFESREKAEEWQDNFISDMKKIGCWPLDGVKVRVEQL